MSSMHGGRVVAKALKAEGVSFVFTLCGGHVMPIYDGCIDEGIGVIDVRHEQTAAHAADGWARVTGQPGVAIVTAGPGLTDAVTGVASAHRANVPMLLFGGQGPRPFADMGSLQDMNHVELMRPITKWATAVPEGRRLAEYVATAFRIATTGLPGPVFLEMPIDQLFNTYEEDKCVFPKQYRSDAGMAGDPRYIERAFELLKRAQRPVALVGTQLRWSRRREAYPKFAETFGLPIYVNGLGRGSLPPTHPNFFSQTRKEALKQADVVIIFGTPLDFRLGYGRESHFNPDAKLIQVDLDGGEIGRNRAIEIGIIGDTGIVMEQLNGLAKSDGYSAALVKPWLDEMRARETQKSERMQPELNSDAVPINPLRACKEIADSLGPDAICIGDGGDFVATAASVLRIHEQGHWLDPGPLGTLGVGPGYAMAAKLAKPKSPVVIIYGDGSFGLHGMEFEAMVRQKINVVGVVGNDAAWQQIRRGQVQLYGEERAVATKLSFVHYEKVVEALGGHGEFVERPEDIRPAMARALAAGKPALVNIRIGGSDFRKDAISI
ncbi:MAG: acetolactate synthase [Deltaproteobacteria bacterium]|nr:acetolactate synthase [Deltaproteobacteria bacterium]MBI3386298.1 acetolactate synthase [Deltaproteobacteria bacterium]